MAGLFMSFHFFQSVAERAAFVILVSQKAASCVQIAHAAFAEGRLRVRLQLLHAQARKA